MWTFCNNIYSSRLFPDASHFRSPEVMCESMEASGAELALINVSSNENVSANLDTFASTLIDSGLDILPITHGCQTAADAINLADRVKSKYETEWIVLQIIGDEATGYPDHTALIEATRELIKLKFKVIPSIAPDPTTAGRLMDAGAAALFLGTNDPANAGMIHHPLLRTIRTRFPKFPLVLNAAVRRPSEAALAMELGFDAVAITHAIAKSRDPISMAEAFADAVVAGRLAYEAGIESHGAPARAGDPATPFWHIADE
ncbi:MAG TPA: hypothetical protein PJ991_01200 [Kiritimatiellia bacterium]|nr:hypothetical protein [Kiritimatiellia bacterium]